MNQVQTSPKQRSGEQPRPESELDVYHEVVSSTVEEGLLAETNLGLGNLDDGEYYQQVESFRFAQFADAAFRRTLLERAIKQTIQELAKQGWTWTESESDGEPVEMSVSGYQDLKKGEQTERDKRQYMRDRGPEIWEDLPEAERIEAMQEFAGMSEQWKPPHWKMIQVRNEASRSRDARLMDNVFGRIREVKSDAEQTVKDRLPGDA